MKDVGDWHPTPDQLAAFDRGQLASAEWDTVEHHVAGCPSCCRGLEAVREDPLTLLLKSSAVNVIYEVSERFDTAHLPAALVAHPRYRILGPLGAGGMGAVFKAEHRLMERTVALKVLHRSLTERPGAVERFRREAKSAARLSHPNVVAAYDADEAGGVHFLVMEFVEGETLDRVVGRRGPLPVAQACDWARQAALGLQYAFEQGMVHRDLKPANLMVTPGGVVKVLDFGLARFAAATTPDPAETPAGMVVGTPDYVAPEQARQGRDADIRADVYSLGCTLYHLLTGRPPFPDGSALQKLLAHQDQEPRPASDLRDELPAELVSVLGRMMAKDPARRFQTPAEAAQALEPFARAEPAPPVRHRWRTVALAAGLGAAALGALLIALVWNGKGAGRPAPGEPKAEAPQQAAEPPPRIAVRQQMEEWLRNEAAPEFERGLRPDILRHYDNRVKPGMTFVVRLSPDLLRSDKATFLVGRQEDFFVLHPTAAVQLASGTMTFQTSWPLDHAFDPDPPVVLSSLTIENVNDLDAFRDIRGKVSYRNRGSVEGDLALRLTVLGTETWTLYGRLDRKELPSGGVLEFEFPPLCDEGKKPPRVVVGILDLCILHAAGQKVKAFVVSRGLASIVYLRP